MMMEYKEGTLGDLESFQTTKRCLYLSILISENQLIFYMDNLDGQFLIMEFIRHRKWNVNPSIISYNSAYIKPFLTYNNALKCQYLFSIPTSDNLLDHQARKMIHSHRVIERLQA